MDAKKKKVIIVAVSLVAVVGVLYLAYNQWGGGTPLFGPGRVDKAAKQRRTFTFKRA